MRHDFVEDELFTPNMTFGHFIRKKRRLIGLNQTDFAEILGVDRGTISMWELGITSPPFDKATEIINKLGGEVMIVNHRGIYYSDHDRTLRFNS